MKTTEARIETAVEMLNAKHADLPTYLNAIAIVESISDPLEWLEFLEDNGGEDLIPQQINGLLYREDDPDIGACVPRSITPIDDETRRLLCLAEMLECLPSELDEESSDLWGQGIVFSYGRAEYAVLTEAEADEACREYTKESLWAFNASFLSGETDIPEEVFEAMQDKYEGANDAFLALVEKTCGLDAFADAAVSADGRGHFLSGYDGEEQEAREYYVYRIN